MTKIIKNIYLYNNEKEMYDVIFDEKIINIKKSINKINSKKILIPSFIDLHNHGGYGIDFNKLDEYNNQQIEDFIKFCLQEGLQGIMITTVSDSLEHLIKLSIHIQKLIDKYPFFLGWHLEGPFISCIKKGAHQEKYITEMYENFLKYLIRQKFHFPIIITFAPEIKNNLSIAKKYQNYFHFQIGHTNANEKEVLLANSCGFNSFTHICNGMNEFNHKKDQASIMNAILNNNLSKCEIICDYIHINESMLRILFNNLDYKHIYLITDSLNCKGLKDGIYMLNNLEIQKINEYCLINNTQILAGSCSYYSTVFKNYLKINNKIKYAVYASSINQINYLKLKNNKFKKNNYANFLILNNSYDIEKIYYHGTLIKLINKK